MDCVDKNRVPEGALGVAMGGQGWVCDGIECVVESRIIGEEGADYCCGRSCCKLWNELEEAVEH